MNPRVKSSDLLSLWNMRRTILRTAEAAFAAERDKFKVPAFLTAIHVTTVGRVAAVDHFVYVIHDRVTGCIEFLHNVL